MIGAPKGKHARVEKGLRSHDVNLTIGFIGFPERMFRPRVITNCRCLDDTRKLLTDVGCDLMTESSNKPDLGKDGRTLF